MSVSVINTTEPKDLASHTLEQFGFNDVFNVVAYSVMSIGKIWQRDWA